MFDVSVYTGCAKDSSEVQKMDQYCDQSMSSNHALDEGNGIGNTAFLDIALAILYCYFIFSAHFTPFAD